MQSLNIADAGFFYIFKCIWLYYEGNIYFLLYLFSLFFLSFYGDGERKVYTLFGGRVFISAHLSRRIREIFLPQFILMAVTVYNPLFPVVLNSFFDVNKEYYRFLWISPVIMCVAAAGAVIVWDICGENKIRPYIAIVFIICLLIAGGSYLYKDGYIVSPTIYHMPTEIPEVAEMIHADSDEEFPRAMLEYDYQMQLRQYDAGILLSCGREDYLRAVAGEVDIDSALEEDNYVDCLLAVVALGIELPEESFIDALEQTHTEYVVISTKGGMIPYLKNAGLTIVGETANHTVLHYEPEEPENFELPDYSEVWRLTPQWYDFLL
ncbi:MAG: hypothetical protein IJT96_01250 [Lachnospiraceae bacterium]|nr:hypothetical protein [Lachnospiraceae bacterium]